MNKKLIGLDVDGVLADFTGFLLQFHNLELEKQNQKFKNGAYKKQFYVEDITEHCVEKFIGQEAWDELFVKLKPYEFVKHLPLYENAQQFVSNLKQIGKVVFVTAPYWKYDSWCSERFYWLQKHFACTEKDVIFTHNKSLFCGDLLIDDNPHFLQEWEKYSIKIVRPWNKSYRHAFSANDYNEAIQMANKLLY